ncbi:MAG: hypothetical protein HFE76_16245 [Firmicutes bacterium]|nr:hypothetical protein [Bacillota bacterium]
MAKKRRSSQFKDSSQVIDIDDARKKRLEKRRRSQKKLAGVRAAEQKVLRPGQKQSRRRRRIASTAIVAVIIAVVGLSVFNITSLKKEQQQIQQRQQELKDIKAEKEEKLKHINDPDYIEDQARTQLRLVMPGEKIYVFPSLENQKKDAKDTQDTTKETTGKEQTDEN